MWSTYFCHDKTSFCCFPQNLAWCGCFKGKGVCATPLELHLFQEFRILSLSTWPYKNTSVWSMIVHFWNNTHFCNILYCQRLRNSWNFKHFNNCRLVPKCIFEVRLDQRFGMPKNHSTYPLEGLAWHTLDITKIVELWQTSSTVVCRSSIVAIHVYQSSQQRRCPQKNVFLRWYWLMFFNACPDWANWTSLSFDFQPSLEMLEWRLECHRRNLLLPPPRAVGLKV